LAANTSGGLTKLGAGTLTLTGVNTYTGNTTISAGTLALSGSGSLASANISVAGTLDASSASLSLASGQTLTNSASATGTLKGSVTTGSGTVSLSYGGSTPSFTVASGTLTLSSGTTFLVDNTSGTALAHGSYKLISATGGSVAASGALPAVTVGGSGFVGGELAYLNLVGGELYLEINQPPVAANNTYTRNGLSSWKIPVSDLLTNATSPDGDTLTLARVGASTNGITLTVNGGWVGYANPNPADDQFTYTVTDAFGGTSTGTITLTIGSPITSNIGGNANGLTVNGTTASMSFAGIPGYTYQVQRSTDLVNWTAIWTNTAPGNGVFSFTDTNAPADNANYRLEWNGN
jgi:autotransporter-associated beta strand protein